MHPITTSSTSTSFSIALTSQSWRGYIVKFIKQYKFAFLIGSALIPLVILITYVVTRYFLKKSNNKVNEKLPSNIKELGTALNRETERADQLKHNLDISKINESAEKTRADILQGQLSEKATELLKVNGEMEQNKKLLESKIKQIQLLGNEKAIIEKELDQIKILGKASEEYRVGLEGSIKLLEAKISNLESDYQSEINAKKLSENNLHELSKLLEDKQHELKISQDKNEEQHQVITDLSNGKENNIKFINDLTTEREALKRKITELEALITSNENNLLNEKNNLTKLKIDLEALKKDIEAQKELLDITVKEKNDWQSKNTEMTFLNTQLKNDLQSLESQITLFADEKNKLVTERSIFQENLKDLESENTVLQENLIKEKNLNDNAQKLLSESKANILSQEETIQILNGEAIKNLLKIKKIEDENQKLEGKNKILEEENKKLSPSAATKKRLLFNEQDNDLPDQFVTNGNQTVALDKDKNKENNHFKNNFLSTPEVVSSANNLLSPIENINSGFNGFDSAPSSNTNSTTNTPFQTPVSKVH